MRIRAVAIFVGLLLFLPFTKALTINIFFPLKISEILLLVLLISVLFITGITKQDKYYVKDNHYLLLFVISAILSFVFNLFWFHDYFEKIVPYRINRVADSFIRLVYIFLNVALFFISIRFFKHKPNDYLKYWLYGAIVASIYGWYVFISSFLDFPYLKLPGMAQKPQQLFDIVRCSTFLEGNYYGVYLLVSLSIAFYLRQFKIGYFLMFSIITSLSTTAMVGAMFFMVMYYSKIIFRKKILFRFVMFLPLGIYLFTLFMKTDYYDLMEKKLFSDSRNLTVENFSKVDRLLTSRMAFNMGKDNLFFGVGPAQFASHYDEYNDIDQYVDNLSIYAVNYFKRRNVRPISNNVYFEIWSEYGLFGLLLYMLFIGSIFIKVLKIKELALTAGFITLLISLNTFPSFIMFFIWAYFAIPVSIYYKRKGLAEADRSVVK